MWLPYNTAPKDGSWFLVIEKDSSMVYAPYEIAFWDDEQFSAKTTDDEVYFYYWMLLPDHNNTALLPKSCAPRDGNWFLAIESDSLECELACWYGEKFSSTDVSDEIYFEYWMPLPPAPNQNYRNG